MMASRRTLLSWTAASVLPLHGRAEAQTSPLRVVASFSILADMVRNVAGDAAAVTALVGPNADAHVFEPTPADARRVAEADLVVVNGLGFEGWLDRLVQASGYRGRVVVASEGVVARQQGGHADPHAWQDLSLGRRYVANLRNALAERTDRRDDINARAAAYDTALGRLDTEVRARFDAIPRSHRRVVTSHDAFEYFGAAYGIDFLAPQGMSTDSESSAAKVARLAEALRHQDVRAVFVENISDPRLVERLAKEGGATVGGKLYSDALSAPPSDADTYLKLIAHNAATIAAALRGESRRVLAPTPDLRRSLA